MLLADTAPAWVTYVSLGMAVLGAITGIASLITSNLSRRQARAQVRMSIWTIAANPGFPIVGKFVALYTVEIMNTGLAPVELIDCVLSPRFHVTDHRFTNAFITKDSPTQLPYILAAGTHARIEVDMVESVSAHYWKSFHHTNNWRLRLIHSANLQLRLASKQQWARLPNRIKPAEYIYARAAEDERRLRREAKRPSQ